MKTEAGVHQGSLAIFSVTVSAIEIVIEVSSYKNIVTTTVLVVLVMVARMSSSSSAAVIQLS